MNERRIEIRYINVLSVFKFFGGTFFLFGLIIGLFASLLRIDVMSSGVARVFPFMTRIGPGVFLGIFFAVVYGISGGIMFSIHALLYNFFAALFGGIVITTRE